MIKPDNFMFYSEQPHTGTAKATSPILVPEGESVVFTSDAKGSSEKIGIFYSLKIPPNTRGGTYNTDVRYSLTGL